MTEKIITPLPTFVNVVMPIAYARKEGKTVVPEWLWDLEPLLMSATFWHDRVLYEKKCKLIIDSAGFQYGGKTKVDRRNEFFSLRERFYRWQCLYGDYIIAGDIPISLTRDFTFIKDCLELTMDNSDLQFKLGAEGRFVNVLHGHSPDVMQYWYKGVGDYPSIGWALGSSIKTAVYGFALQCLTLYELGAFKQPIKMLHCLGAVGKNVAIGMHYIVEQLGISTEMLSFDASSSSAERFGNFVTETGEIVGFGEIRRGEKTITLWDGEVLTTVPAVLRSDFKHKVSRTNITNSTKAWNLNVVKCAVERGVDYDRTVEEGGGKFVWDTYKELGLDGLTKELDRKGFMNRARVMEHKDQYRLL